MSSSGLLSVIYNSNIPYSICVIFEKDNCEYNQARFCKFNKDLKLGQKLNFNFLQFPKYLVLGSLHVACLKLIQVRQKCTSYRFRQIIVS